LAGSHDILLGTRKVVGEEGEGKGKRRRRSRKIEKVKRKYRATFFFLGPRPFSTFDLRPLRLSFVSPAENLKSHHGNINLISRKKKTGKRTQRERKEGSSFSLSLTLST
jgi:hypothetical protein